LEEIDYRQQLARSFEEGAHLTRPLCESKLTAEEQAAGVVKLLKYRFFNLFSPTVVHLADQELAGELQIVSAAAFVIYQSASADNMM
jgi:hypothetical protein